MSYKDSIYLFKVNNENTRVYEMYEMHEWMKSAPS